MSVMLDYQSVKAKLAALMEGESEKELIDRCQRLGFEKDSDRPLSVDGVEGPKTRAGRFVDPSLLMANPNLKVGLMELLKGSREIGGSNMGPFVRVYFRLKSDPARNAGPFCAGGASYCLDQAYPEDDTPYIVGAIRLGNAIVKEGALKRKLKLSELKIGDFVIHERKTDTPGTGHVSQCVAVLSDNRILSLDFNVGSFPAPTRCFISGPDGLRGDDKFLFGARWK